MNIDRAFSVDNGVLIDEETGGPFVTGGPASPVGLDLPEKTIYFQTITGGVLIWRKFGSLISEWRQLSSQDLPFDPSTVDLTSLTAQQALVDLANRHFGKDTGFVQDLGTIITTSITFVPLLTLNFNVSPAAGGTYRFGWSAVTLSSKLNTEGTVRLVIDSGLPGEIVIAEGLIINVPRTFTGFDAGVLAAGAHTVSLEARIDVGNGSLSLSKLRIEEWRVL